jgi:hypothetical protein
MRNFIDIINSACSSKEIIVESNSSTVANDQTPVDEGAWDAIKAAGKGIASHIGGKWNQQVDKALGKLGAEGKGMALQRTMARNMYNGFKTWVTGQGLNLSMDNVHDAVRKYFQIHADMDDQTWRKISSGNFNDAEPEGERKEPPALSKDGAKPVPTKGKSALDVGSDLTQGTPGASGSNRSPAKVSGAKPSSKKTGQQMARQSFAKELNALEKKAKDAERLGSPRAKELRKQVADMKAGRKDFAKANIGQSDAVQRGDKAQREEGHKFFDSEYYKTAEDKMRQAVRDGNDAGANDLARELFNRAKDLGLKQEMKAKLRNLKKQEKAGVIEEDNLLFEEILREDQLTDTLQTLFKNAAKYMISTHGVDDSGKLQRKSPGSTNRSKSSSRGKEVRFKHENKKMTGTMTGYDETGDLEVELRNGEVISVPQSAIIAESENGRQYQSLNDVFPPGDTEIWYFKPDMSREMVSWEFVKKRNLVDPNDLTKTHVLLGKIAEKDPEIIFYEMQGEKWSPRGEARDLIQKSGAWHTSMSIGDVVVIDGVPLFADRDGFVQMI